MNARALLALVGFAAVCLAAGGIGGVVTAPAIPGWYAALRKPEWTPPGGVFGPVWTVLYLTMAVSAWLVWRRVGFSGAPAAFALFGVQLLLNAGWSLIFFGLRLPGAAFAELLLLWATILATLLAFRRLSPAAAWLLVPYLAWVTFAGALNFAIWRMNL